MTPKENARLALAAFPHCAREAIHRSLGSEDRDRRLAETAEDALDLGWMLVNGEPVAPGGWDATYETMTAGAYGPPEIGGAA